MEDNERLFIDDLLFYGSSQYTKCDDQKILTRVHYLLEHLMANGVKFFGVGGAIGFDMIVAEYLLDLRDRQGKKIKIISVLPFPDWREKWSEDEIRRQDEIMRRSDKVTFISDAFCKDVYLIRDRKLGGRVWVLHQLL